MKEKENKLRGYSPNIDTSDELDFLRRLYTSEQIKEMWESCKPKLIRGETKLPIITGTPKGKNKQ